MYSSCNSEHFGILYIGFGPILPKLWQKIGTKYCRVSYTNWCGFQTCQKEIKASDQEEVNCSLFSWNWSHYCISWPLWCVLSLSTYLYKIDYKQLQSIIAIEHLYQSINRFCRQLFHHYSLRRSMAWCAVMQFYHAPLILQLESQ